MTHRDAPLLLVIGGLPGTGKTAVVRALAAATGSTFLRTDSIEQAIRDAGVLAGDVGPSGYAAAAAQMNAPAVVAMTP